MKKLILIILVLAILMGCIGSFASCDKKDPVVLSREGKEQKIIKGLSDYLFRLNSLINPTSSNFEDKINSVHGSGSQALHVAFDSKDYYFVCAYYNSDHSEDKYCCLYKYTWVMFYGQNDITEHYENKDFVVAFQINKAKFVKDIVNKSADTPAMEHFSVYSPEFRNGVNVSDPLCCDESYIYFRSSEFGEEDYILDSSENRFHEYSVMPCVKYKTKYYIAQETKVGYQNEKDLTKEFGEYYDDLMEMIITDKYTEEINGKTHYYGLLDIKEFSKKFLE